MITISARQPVIIAGPTASGKSALALHIAERQGGVVINADAMQMYDGWPILSAQPDAADKARAPHALYGTILVDGSFDLGAWLDAVEPYLYGRERPIIVGGTGLYLTSLTHGLSPVPDIPARVRTLSDAQDITTMIAQIDPDTQAMIDLQNPRRVQRAWEVQHHTGKGMAYWHKVPVHPLLPRDQAACIVLDAPKDWLTPRITRRFDLMCDAGLLDEGRAMMSRWNPQNASSKTIGAAQVIAHLRDELSLPVLREAITVQTRQYAKRQRTWVRAKMADWPQISAAMTDMSDVIHFSP